MSNFDTLVWAQVTTVINAQWSDINGQIYRATQINRRNWLELLEGGEITPPYCVFDIRNRKLVDWGMQNKAFLYPAEIYYITDAVSTNIVADVTAKMVLIRDALYTPSANVQMLEDPIISVDDTNPANLTFFDLQSGLFAGQLYAQLLVGETY